MWNVIFLPTAVFMVCNLLLPICQHLKALWWIMLSQGLIFSSITLLTCKCTLVAGIMPTLTFVCNVSKYILECTCRFPGIEKDRQVSTKTYSSHMPGLPEPGLVQPFHWALHCGLSCCPSPKVYSAAHQPNHLKYNEVRQ